MCRESRSLVASDLLERKPAHADHRISYGQHPLQFGDLRLPSSAAGSRVPVVVFIHGGWWKAAYTLEYGGHLCEALRSVGVATWSLEYRRVGDEGGGYPGTFQDVAAGFDFLLDLSKSFALDLDRVVVVGHSAGGMLAFWLAGRARISPLSLLYRPLHATPIRAVVSLAGALDLRLTIDLAGEEGFAHIRDEVVNLMGGTPEQIPERYLAANPGDLLPLGVPQILIQGSADDQIPRELPLLWAERVRRYEGDDVSVDLILDADHLDIVDPLSEVWPRVQAAIVQATLLR